MFLYPNTTFDNHYTLIRQLGLGGFSEVWLAHDSYMDIDVAIKIYAPGQGMDSNSINEFRREITGVFQLNHSNLLCPKHLGIWENMPYLIMAYCPAGSCLKFVGNISESEIWHLIHDVAAGLAYLHEKDIVHQDIKPDNILIDTEGNYLITDFGISTRARSTLQKSVVGSSISHGSGTVAYMGPERFSRQPAPTKASDIWSFGAMVFELLEGIAPFGMHGGGMQKSGAEIPFINANVSENLKQTIYKMLSKETWDRPTAATLVEWASNPSSIEIDYSLLSEEGSSAQTQSVPASVAETPTPQPEGRVTQRFSNAEPLAGVNNTFPSSSKKIDNGPSSNASSEGKPAKKKKSKAWIWLIFGAITLIGLAIFLSSWLEKAEKEHRNELASQIYVDLGLPSGTLWKNANEGGEATFYNYDEAVSRFSNKLPTTEQLEELKDKCTWIWTTQYGVKGYKVIGPNGNNIFLPAAGGRGCGGDVYGVGSYGGYWSSTPYDSDDAWYLLFDSSGVRMNYYFRCNGRSVRLVQNL